MDSRRKGWKILNACIAVTMPHYEGLKTCTQEAFKLRVAAVNVLISIFIFTPCNDGTARVKGLGTNATHNGVDMGGIGLSPSFDCSLHPIDKRGQRGPDRLDADKGPQRRRTI
ncbi:MAG: hypothetical protein J4F46_01705 [Dehalococcoidia bacterium]|nr:hypothetical protein [Dehalococcoidia bacterium]